MNVTVSPTGFPIFTNMAQDIPWPMPWLLPSKRQYLPRTGDVTGQTIYREFLRHMGFYTFLARPLDGPHTLLLSQTEERLRLARPSNPTIVDELTPYICGAAQYALGNFVMLETTLASSTQKRSSEVDFKMELFMMGIGAWVDLPAWANGGRENMSAVRKLTTDSLIWLDVLFFVLERRLSAENPYIPRIYSPEGPLRKLYRLPYTHSQALDVTVPANKKLQRNTGLLARQLADFRVSRVFETGAPPTPDKLVEALSVNLLTQDDVFVAVAGVTLSLGKEYPALAGVAALSHKLRAFQIMHTTKGTPEVWMATAPSVSRPPHAFI